jgi:hypothetical protein
MYSLIGSSRQALNGSAVGRPVGATLAREYRQIMPPAWGGIWVIGRRF